MVTSRYILPTIVERTGRGEYAVDPYSKLFTDRVVFLGVPVDDACANDVMAQLLYLDHDMPGREISLYLNSPGGSVTAMMAIHDTMRFVMSDIRTVCLGQANSVAAILLAAGTRGKRLILPNARVVLRQPELPVEQGSASDLEIQANEVLRTRDVMVGLLAGHTGRDLDRVRRDLDRDTILPAADALAYGLVDELIGSRKALAQLS